MPSGNNRPKYNTALQAAALTQTLRPPASFDGVTARVFPLKANMARLQKFCDDYLNKDVPPTVSFFQPAIPYVFLGAINYGRMSAEFANLGWMSQREVGFIIPLEWRQEQDGRLAFRDWALVAPFIFVDDSWSLTTGREVYGWPKIKAWLTPEIDSWMMSPLLQDSVMTLSTMVFPELYEGKRQEPRVLVEIERQPPPSFSLFPPDPWNPLNPLVSLPQALLNLASAVGTAAEILLGLPSSGYVQDRNLQSLKEMVVKLLQYASPFASAPSSNNITLKQFRDAEEPLYICYQALLNSRIDLRRLNKGGLLGDLNILRGDLTGGFRVKMPRYEEQPIIERLGIEVAEEYEVQGQRVAVLHPTLPFWLDADLDYGFGDPLCWRTKQSSWHIPTPSGDQPTTPPEEIATPLERKHLYNTSQGASQPTITGPFLFPNVTIRVLPLMAAEERLKQFCEEYLANPYYRFEPWGSYVYLFVTNYGEMFSASNNIGWWAEREATFAIPLKWYRRDTNELVSVAMVSPFIFTDSDAAAITGREVDGRPVIFADLKSPGDTWLTEDGPSADRHLLKLRTEVLPALFLGQKAEERTVMEIHQEEICPAHDEDRWRKIAAQWGKPLLEDIQEKARCVRQCREEFANLKALSFEVLAHDEPFNEVTLKQFRDATDPNAACYQALVLSQRFLEEVYEVHEITDRMHVRLYQYPSFPIIDILGLRVKSRETSGVTIVDQLQPIRPFWMHVALRQELGKNLCWRAGSEEWHRPMQLEPRYFTEPTLTHIEQHLPEAFAARQRHPSLKIAMRELRQNIQRASQPVQPLTRETVRTAVLRVPPQVVVESLLGREEPPPSEARARGRRMKRSNFYIRGDSLGPLSEQLFSEQLHLVDGHWQQQEEEEEEQTS
ncbi:MAG: hypothetical protein AB7P69_20095 [Candidatus Binatia bacterium]